MTPTVGVIGGGQLARMMVPPAIALGIDVRVLAEHEGDSAGIAVAAVGDHRILDDVLRFVQEQQVDVVTFDHEHVPQPVLAGLVERGITVRPGPDALRYAQDKLLMRERLGELGLPVPEWARVETPDALDDFLEANGGRAVLKTPRGGYDGKGVRLVRSAAEAEDWFRVLAEDGRGGALLAEELVDFRRELSQVLARRPSGELVLWPLVESIQRDGVCAEVIAPAPGSAGRLADVAADVATAIAERLDVTGVLAVELFETTDERILVNELAMRPHNSGHWTIDGATTSQFEQHLRAVLDLPLGATGCTAEWAIMVNVFGVESGPAMPQRYPVALADQPTVKFHSYAKEPRPGRKLGHVTALGDDLDDVAYRARAAAAFFEA